MKCNFCKKHKQDTFLVASEPPRYYLYIPTPIPTKADNKTIFRCCADCLELSDKEMYSDYIDEK